MLLAQGHEQEARLKAKQLELRSGMSATEAAGLPVPQMISLERKKKNIMNSGKTIDR